MPKPYTKLLRNESTAIVVRFLEFWPRTGSLPIAFAISLKNKNRTPNKSTKRKLLWRVYCILHCI
jgi:hypothetical protein